MKSKRKLKRHFVNPINIISNMTSTLTTRIQEGSMKPREIDEKMIHINRIILVRITVYDKYFFRR